ncbi:hypothetical protein M378DRAFT_168066 [Amanita muscaria Koide BX008]|uniref:Uncharacterized protein n=1 Tax=Amanita muscaria (strain Koide BX008) TaxID=946122 RepID=A0A0C2WUL5_AMAMK|nr:hypothetical protein M378DRAFT_168066 [Amanita muscaria Koide BX008]
MSISITIGVPIPSFKGLYKFSIFEEKPPIGGHFVLRGSNTAIVERTYGLLETQVVEEELDRPSFLLPTLPRMDPRRVRRHAVGRQTFNVFALMMLLFDSPWGMRFHFWFGKLVNLPGNFMIQLGEGLLKSQTNSFTGTKLNTSGTQPPIQVKSVIKITGGPGYLKTASTCTHFLSVTFDDWEKPQTRIQLCLLFRDRLNEAPMSQRLWVV